MDNEKTTNSPFFFIVGRARSGTTLLRCLFDAHPQVVIPLECAFIVHLYPKYRRIKNWTPDKLMALYDDILTYPKFHFWTLDHNALKQRLLEAPPNSSYAGLCRMVYSGFESFFPKGEILLTGDKNPSYSFHTKLLTKLFPEARFIHITRDYRDNIVSMIRARFEAPRISSLAYRWKFSNRQVLKHRKKDPGRFVSIKYEDLVSHPEPVLRQLCSFLQLDYHPQMLHYHEKLDELMQVYPRELIDRHHKSLFKPINANGLGEWKTTLSETQVKTADHVVGPFAEICGYQRKYPHRNFFFYLSCWPGMIYGHLLFIFMGFLNRLPMGIRMKIINYLAVKYKKDWKVFKRKDINPDK